MTVGRPVGAARPKTDLPNERRPGESDQRRPYELAVVSEWGVILRWLYHPPSQLPGKGDTFAAGDVQRWRKGGV